MPYGPSSPMAISLLVGGAHHSGGDLGLGLGLELESGLGLEWA